MRVFGIEVRGNVSPFPWWNHWPEAQIPSDGRYCQAPDRASHFSLAWGGPPIHKGEGLQYWASWIYGTTTGRPEELSRLARSWLTPPQLTVTSSKYQNQGYDAPQRVYLIQNKNPNEPEAFEAQILASEESPIANLCLIIKDWGDAGASILVDGKQLKDEGAIKLGKTRKIEGTDLVVWIEKKSSVPMKIEIAPET